jgi:hypothetical protein
VQTGFSSSGRRVVKMRAAYEMKKPPLVDEVRGSDLLEAKRR